MSEGVLVWLSVRNKMQIRCSWCYCHPIIFCFVKIQKGCAFQVLAHPGCPEKRPLNGFSCIAQNKTYSDVLKSCSECSNRMLSLWILHIFNIHSLNNIFILFSISAFITMMAQTFSVIRHYCCCFFGIIYWSMNDCTSTREPKMIGLWKINKNNCPLATRPRGSAG